MSLCPCGNEADEGSPLCARCAALQVLELPSSASPDEIKAAWHLLVKVWHPDRFQTDKSLRQAAEEKLKAINSAYRLLTSPPEKVSRFRRSQRKPRRAAASQPPAQAKASSNPSPAGVVAAAARAALPSFWTTLAAMTVLQRVLILVCGIAAGGVTLKFVDSQLASDPATAAVYSQYRAQMADAIEAPKRRVWDIVDAIGRKFNPPKPIQAPAAAAAPQPASSGQAAQPAPGSHAATVRSPKRGSALVPLAPFITVGLTRDEVIAVAGAPASSSGDKLVYNGAEFDFKDGRVSGWKIDPAASPLRVKLWPESAVDPTLDVFSVGSTKDDVLLVQGTPTLLAADKFGYGSSEIYFRNNRVVSWKNDPASVPLRAVSR